ncbi:TIGR02117 family protein [Hymenobacter endophyticus]|uniref:TIGR02117 family protein n=1 Tax=Hymenobacter endophyticus TaxID=3076335 RepID=A0ABU3TJ43_9BACT|nr:TIGR02117 family protein [Hymenobacter endophyticus]MDU0371388.1 TIGR02117 family protein [Hymenobacter endophyticus]
MKIPIKQVVKGVAWTGAGLVGAVVVYLAASAALSAVPVAATSNAPVSEQPIEAYILSNGVHTDLVVPVRSAHADWTQLVPYTDTPAADSTMQFVGFGWGDKGFYLDTPTWAELKPSTAVKAMFWLGTTAMHTTFHHRPVEGPDCVRLQLSPAEYARLVAFIKGSFDFGAQGRPQHIKGHSYGQHDAFYEARRTYNLFYTCNTWANNGLKAAGQKAALWTPFDFGIFWQYR